jgi:hypothetical protein
MNEILSFIHCRLCLEELPKDTSPREWVKIEAGRTEHGLQVWCIRHEKNIVHIDMKNSLWH